MEETVITLEKTTLVSPVKVSVTEPKETGKLKEALNLSDEDWEKLNAERKKVIDQYKNDFIDGFIQQRVSPSFSKAEVMAFIQDNMSQQGILMLATEQIGQILQDALERAETLQKDPMGMLLAAMLAGKNPPNPNLPSPGDE